MGRYLRGKDGKFAGSTAGASAPTAADTSSRWTRFLRAALAPAGPSTPSAVTGEPVDYSHTYARFASQGPHPFSAAAAGVDADGWPTQTLLGPDAQQKLIADAYAAAEDPRTMAYGIHQRGHNRVAALAEAYREQIHTPRLIPSQGHLGGRLARPYDVDAAARLASSTAYNIVEMEDAPAMDKARFGAVGVYRAETVALARRFNNGDPTSRVLRARGQMMQPYGETVPCDVLHPDVDKFMRMVREDQAGNARLRDGADEHQARMAWNRDRFAL